ncbi:hypothetical protein IAE22_29350, partial [Bacillus sp. S34]|nr:hypothetical protein [Bacillus sp. S34]
DKNIVGQWQQTGTDDVPVWTPRAIESDVIANLDVGKLSAGQAAIAQVVAMKIAASTASIQTVNVENLFVTSGATMKQAVIDYLFANVVAAKKITSDMIDVNSLNGVTITGAIIKSAATGARIEMQGTRLDVYGPGAAFAATIRGQTISGSDGSTQTQMLFYVPTSGANPYGQLSVGNALPWYRNTTSVWKTSWTPNCDVTAFNNAGLVSSAVGA